MPQDQKLPFVKQVGQAPARVVDLVVIHCSATPSGKLLQFVKPGAPGYLNAPQIINAWHAARGFKRQPDAVRAYSPDLPSIGYHYVIDLTGEVWAGRALSEVGAHALNFNARSVGICMVGGLEKQAQYTAEQWASLRQLVQGLLATFGIAAAPPKWHAPAKRLLCSDRIMSGGVCGHRDLSPDGNGNGQIEPFEWLKTCPGFDVQAWLAHDMQPLPSQVCEVSV